MAERAGFLQNRSSLATTAIHEGAKPEDWGFMAVIPPIFLATTYKQDVQNENNEFYYGRCGNPTRRVAEKCLAALDEAKHGILVSSGMAAISTVVNLLSVGDHLITSIHFYIGLKFYFDDVATRSGIEVSFVDPTDVESVQRAIRPATRMVWVETPTNPAMKVVDIKTIADMLKRHPDVLLVVDNTTLSPYFQRPLTLGADISLQSCTKYLTGHSDVIGGVICTNDDSLNRRLRFLQEITGPVASPIDCYLLNRSLKTLPLRMERHMANGIAVAQFLEAHPDVEGVCNPALPSHPQYQLSKEQCFGHSGVINFCIKGHNLETTKKFLSSLKLIIYATSFGGCESNIMFPSRMSYKTVSKEECLEMGVTDGLLRFSVGLEDPKDIIEDLDQALRKTFE